MAIPTIEDVPLHLMPVAIALMYAFVYCVSRVAVLTFKSSSGTSSNNGSKSVSIKSTTANAASKTKYGLWAALAFGGYCFVVGQIEGAYQKAAYAQFDPYTVLELSQYQSNELNKTIVTDAYKSKVRYYHPSNVETGNSEQLQQVIFAFQALTDESAKRKWKQYGHPSGPLLTPTFQFAIPSWLVPILKSSTTKESSSSSKSDETPPPSSTTTSDSNVNHPMLLSVHVVLLTIVSYWMYQDYRQSSSSSSSRGGLSASMFDDADNEDDDWNIESNGIPDRDFVYLAQHVKPNMNQYELLVLVLTCPSNLVWGKRDVQKIEYLRQERLQKLSEMKQPKYTFDDLLNEGGWADDDEEESEEEKQARKEAEEKKKSEVLLEGVDQGVLGQQWVERTLESKGEWPPKELGCLNDRTFDWEGTSLPPLEHPVIRRMLCMISGRLNSQMLNSHPDLVQAGINKLIDQSYFQSSLTFRHRMTLLLEAVLKIGTAFQSYRLVKTGIETVVIFKIGCKVGSENWFKDVMVKQYGMSPTLNLHTLEIATPNETEIATGENTQVTFELERSHAENFLRQKLSQLEQQGIPPQVGLQAYREGWWFLVRAERLDGKGKVSPLNRDDPVIQKMQLSDAQFALFNNEDPKDRLLATLPMMLGNIAQKQIRAQGMVKAPLVAGEYEFTLEIKSIDFLGADVSRTVKTKVVDASTVVRKPKPATADTAGGTQTSK